MPTEIWRRDARTLLLITIPFAVVVAGLVVVMESPLVGGWEPLTLVLYAVGVVALWGAVVVCYLAWIVFRDGWQLSSLPAGAVLLLVAAAAATWGVRSYADEAACRDAHDFYEGLAALGPEAQTEAIGRAGRIVTRPSTCGIVGMEGLLVAGSSAAAAAPADARRRAVLERLLEGGLPPEPFLVDMVAVRAADPEAVRLVMLRRRALNAVNPEDWPVVPAGLLDTLLRHAGACGGSPPDSEQRRYRAVLHTVLDVGQVEPAGLPAHTHERLACLGMPDGGAPSGPEQGGTPSRKDSPRP